MSRFVIAFALVGCTHAQAPGPTASTPVAAHYETTTIALPGASVDGVGMDYLLYDPRTSALWVPAGNTGSVDVIAVATGAIHRIPGFATTEVERRDGAGGTKRIVGPSAAALGPAGTVYIGNRGDASVCAVDEVALTIKACGHLDAMPDGVIYVAARHEVWVTTPRDQSVRILDATTLAQTARLAFDGSPEGFAVDAARGRFYTNLEDKDLTLAIDLATHATVATWHPSCGEDGPHGLRFVDGDGLLIVACSDRVETLDVAHDGRRAGALATGDGVDDVDYDVTTHRIVVGGAKAGTLTIGALAHDGAITSVAVVPTAEGARNGVAGPGGKVYLAHSRPGEIVVVSPVP
ncbi:MAG: hypothetical protein NT062_21305 [Proteobacteria bacterium]|nr:hypothetical protein [Pseudomonadota bacterium]